MLSGITPESNDAFKGLGLEVSICYYSFHILQLLVKTIVPVAIVPGIITRWIEFWEDHPIFSTAPVKSGVAELVATFWGMLMEI